jgi:hypothetical protein
MIRSTNNNQQLKQILAEELSKELPIDEIAEQDIPVEANRTQTQQVILTERQQTKAIETLTAQLLQNQLPKLDTAAMKKVIAQQSQTPLAELSAQVRNLAKHIQVLPESNPLLEVFQQLEMALSRAEGSPLPSGMDMRAALDVMGEADQIEQTLHQTISANVTQPANQKAASDPLQKIIRQFAMMLSALQGRPGQSPLGYSPEAFDPKKSAEKKTSKNEGNSETGEISETENSYGSGDPAAQKDRLEEAKKLKEGGKLAGGKADEKPKLSESEQKAIAAKVAAADDDGSAAIANDPETLKKLTPEQKGALIRKLMDGHTSDSEDRAIARIMQSCGSKKEWDTVMQHCGGHKVFEELDDDTAKNMFQEADRRCRKTEQEGATKGVELLEKCENPEEAKELMQELGGANFKGQVKDPEVLKRLEAVAKRFELPGLGYGLPPEKVKEKREAINRAAVEENSDLAVQLSEDKDAMKVATPDEKAKLIKELQRGWTKDSQDAAIKRILLSCKTKEEFDELVNLVGGKSILEDMDDDESKTKINQLMGGWGRTDLADDPALAKQYENVLADSKRKGELTSTRKPSQSDLNAVGPEVPSGSDSDPLMEAGNQAKRKVKSDMGDQMYDVNSDPQASNELALIQRGREIDGKPKLDFTELTAEANRIASAPDFESKVQEYAKANDISDPKEAREKYMTQQMDHLRLKYGLSEQEMSGLVTKRMAHIYGKGAEQMNGYSQAIVAPLKQQLAEVERTYGPNSPQAMALRAQIAKFENSTGAFTQQLSNVSEAARSMYPVPTSFWEDVVSALGPIADIAASICAVIPGVGPAITGVYFGVKAAVAAAKGDVLGVFSSVASALPGVGGVIGGATGAALNTAGKLAQAGIGFGTSVANGNVLGAVGSLAGAGVVSGPAIDYARRGLAFADGISRGDVTGIVNGATGMLDPVVGSNPYVQQVTQYTQKAAPFIDAIVSGDASKAFGIISSELGPFVANNPDAARALGLVNDGIGFINSLGNGEYANAFGGLVSNYDLLNAGPGAQLVNSFGQVSNLVGALSSGNPQQLVDVLRGENGFLQTIGSGALSQSVGQISDLANQAFMSPAFQTINDLTRSGSRFLRAIAGGDLLATLNNFAGLSGFANPQVSQLLQMLNSAQPMFQSMMRGDYQIGLDEIRRSAIESEVADQFKMFEAFSDLVKGDARKSLEAYHANLGQLVELRNEIEHFEKLEEATQNLQERFGEDFTEMSNYLIRNSGYRPALLQQIPA